MNILAVGAHFDDVELGCGATLKKLNDEGHNIIIYVGTKSGFKSASNYNNTVRRDEDAFLEGQRSAKMIGAELICGEFRTFSLDYCRELDTIITQIVEKNNIDWIFSNWSDDPHHDHWGLAKAVFHGGRHVKRILAYHSNWYSSNCSFSPNFFVNIDNYWEFKKKLLKCFASEYYRVGEKWMTLCKSEALLNGLKNDCKYAEGFQCIRWCY